MIHDSTAYTATVGLYANIELSAALTVKCWPYILGFTRGLDRGGKSVWIGPIFVKTRQQYCPKN